MILRDWLLNKSEFKLKSNIQCGKLTCFCISCFHWWQWLKYNKTQSISGRKCFSVSCFNLPGGREQLQLNEYFELFHLQDQLYTNHCLIFQNLMIIQNYVELINRKLSAIILIIASVVFQGEMSNFLVRVSQMWRFVVYDGELVIYGLRIVWTNLLKLQRCFVGHLLIDKVWKSAN